MSDLSAEIVREALFYDHETGEFHWRVKPSPRTKAGSLAGRKDWRGYWQINFRNKKYSSHRLAWLYVHGVWPSGQIDHINQNPSDNRIANLRDVSCSENNRNKKRKAKGVTKHKQTGKWQATIRLPGKTKYLGLFLTEGDAKAAFEAAKAELW